VARAQSCKQGYDNFPFHEIILDDDGEYDIDVDFDGTDEKITADENSNILVLKKDMSGVYIDVSTIIPYSIIRIHRCCDVHRAYTVIDHLHHTIYSEAHYSSYDRLICQYRKVGETWIEITPIEPLSIMQYKYLFPVLPKGWVYYGNHGFWKW
jgi:hypothetical protein